MPLTQVTETAFAKVNLTLHVTGQRADGYHLLDSLVVFAGFGDVLDAALSDATTLTLHGRFAGEIPADGDNLVLRAARQFGPDLALAFALQKNLPPASGIGGGSADAAAAIRAIQRLRPGAPQQLHSIDPTALLALGADLPVCLAATTARMRGIGERIDAVPPLPALHILLVNPRVAVPTPLVFRALTSRDNPPMPDILPDWPDAASFAYWLKSQRNDLQPPALTLASVIAEVLASLHAQPGALIARMSGSGATCFALFETAAAASAAASAIGAARPGWWAAAGPVLPNGQTA